MKPEDFPRTVRSTAERYDMDLSRPLAMASGGPDSVALLRSLVALGVKPIVLHLDHGLREESGEDAEFVRELCLRLDVRCELRNLDLEDGPNLQERARTERYRISEELADTFGLTSIATGHTADDVAETMLMNLARGTGPRGLSGIPPVRGRVVRPLIERGRAEVLVYLDHLSQPYRTDPTNLTHKYTRNRVRLDVLPVLEELYPGAGANLARAASLLRDDVKALEDIAAGMVHARGAEVIIPLPELARSPRAIRRYAIRHAYSRSLPDGRPLGSGHVEAVLELARRDHGTRTLDLPGGVVAAVRGKEEVSFYRPVRVTSEQIALDIGELEFAGWIFEAREVREYDAEDAALPEVAYLDAAHGPYHVRLAREGDTIRPLGLGGTKKVFRAMMDRKMPGDIRRSTPVVVDGGGRVVWISGGEMDEGVRVVEHTVKMLRVEVRKARGDVQYDARRERGAHTLRGDPGKDT